MNQYDIDTLEHESGLRPLGEYPAHCERCRLDSLHRARQAACEHSEAVEHKTWSGTMLARTCADCGMRLEVE